MIEPGTSFDGYRVKRQIGRGGMGVVYEATQLSLDRPVALKVLRPELADDKDFVRRFRREGRLQASLEHPHVLDVYEVGESVHGLFLAMRLVRGRSIAELIRSRDLGASKALRLFAEVAGALDAAHAIELVHRDVKPENMLLDEEGRAYLSDFGLTRSADGTVADSAARPLLGTFAYAAPEVIRGEEPEPASDRYSFAAALFQGLTGEEVFPRGSDAAVLYAHASEQPPSISARRPELPARLDPIFKAALAKASDERPASTRELVESVAKALAEADASGLGPPEAGSPVSMATSPIGAGPLVGPKHGRRGRLAALAMALVLATVTVGVAVAALIGDGNDEPAGSGVEVPPVAEGAQALGSDLGSYDRSVGCLGNEPQDGGAERSCAILQTELPGATLLVPEAGTIVGWAVRGASGDLALDVIRQRGEETSRVLRSQYAFAGNDAPTWFPTDLPVERGDVLGVELGQGSTIGVRDVAGATTDRWFAPAGGAFGLADRGPGTGFDYEAMLRVDFVPGGERELPKQLTGAAAANAPDGRVVDEDSLQISVPRVKVDVVLVEVEGAVALDLFDGEKRRARLFLPDLIPGGEPVSLRRYPYPGEGFGEADVWWVNPNSGRMIFHFAHVFPRHFEYQG